MFDKNKSGKDEKYERKINKIVDKMIYQECLCMNEPNPNKSYSAYNKVIRLGNKKRKYECKVLKNSVPTFVVGSPNSYK